MIPDIPPPGQAAALRPGLRWLRFPLPFPPSHVNVWLLEDGPGWLAIDCSIANDASRDLWREALGGDAFARRPLQRLLVTHFHPDHAGLMGWLAEGHGLVPLMTKIEWLQARALWFDTGAEMVEHQARFAEAAGAPSDYADFIRARGPLYVKSVAPLPRVFEAIADGQHITIGGRLWRVITGQGHAPDMACLFNAEDRVLIAADQILPRISPYVGLHAGEPAADPLGAFLVSLDRFRALPHDARLDWLAAHHAERLSLLMDAMADSSAHDLLPVLFRRPLDVRNLGFGLGETLAHLRRLQVMGEAIAEEDAAGVMRWRRA
jgi:glyoxylase-like metal-dependent hydrolase (beta-lactamase superfamily II)